MRNWDNHLQLKNAYIVTWGKTESRTIFSITGILENGVDLKGQDDIDIIIK